MVAFSSNLTKISISAKRSTSPTGWINDDGVRKRFIHGRIKIVVTPKYLDLSLFEREGFMFPGWLKSQELSSLVQLKGYWYLDLVKVFYHNLKLVNGDIHSRVKGVDNDTLLHAVSLKVEGVSSHLLNSTNSFLKMRDVYKVWLRYYDDNTRLSELLEKDLTHEGLRMEERIMGHILAFVILPARIPKPNMTAEDIYLLYALKNDIPMNWVDVLKEHMTESVMKKSLHLPYAVLVSRILGNQSVNTDGERRFPCNCRNEINQNTLISFGLTRNLRGWCFKGEENLLYLYGSTSLTSEQRKIAYSDSSCIDLATNHLQNIVDKLNLLEVKIDHIIHHCNEEDMSEDDSMDSHE